MQGVIILEVWGQWSMQLGLYSIIIGTGSYIPPIGIPNTHFLDYEFFYPNGERIEQRNEDVIRKFEEITGITERRHVEPGVTGSEIAYIAARGAIDSANINPESLDLIIVAHNFGDVKPGRYGPDLVPSLAARVKHKLGIKSPSTVAFDLGFGCPGWLHGMWLANLHLTTGNAKRALVIGAETLSAVSDPHDRDSMIYADGAGATILEAIKAREQVGILSYAARSDTKEHAFLLHMGPSYNPNYESGRLFLKMRGREVYEYALKFVPEVVKESMDKAGITLDDVSKVLLHQANEKMDLAILKRLLALYGIKKPTRAIMPMTISWLGNSSVATLPTLLDLLLKGELDDHTIQSGDIVLLASVGAGMNINAMVYKFP